MEIKEIFDPSMVIHCHFSTWVAKGWDPQVKDLPETHSKTLSQIKHKNKERKYKRNQIGGNVLMHREAMKETQEDSKQKARNQKFAPLYRGANWKVKGDGLGEIV